MVVFVAAPTEQRAVLHHGHRIMTPSADRLHVFEVEGDFGLEVAIAAPGNHGPVGLDGHRVITSSRDVGNCTERRRDGDLADGIAAIPFDNRICKPHERVILTASDLLDPLELGRDVALAKEIVAPTDDRTVGFEGQTMRVPCGDRTHTRQGKLGDGDLATRVGTPAIHPTAFECEGEVGPDRDVSDARSTAGWNVCLVLFVHAPGNDASVVQQTEDKRAADGTLFEQIGDGGRGHRARAGRSIGNGG